MATFFDTNKYSASVSTANWIATGHDGADAMIIGGSGKLILSASNGTTHISGAIDIGLVPDNKAYHIRTIAGPLILSSSGGGSFVYASGNLTVEQALLVKGDTVLSGNVVVGGQLYDLNSNLILSSSVGSVVAASSSLDFPNADKAYHIRAVNSRLILSSSVGSYVEISGGLGFANSAVAAHVVERTGYLIFSSSVGSVVAISASEDFTNADKAYHVRSVNSHLIFSSSAGSAVYISGNLQVSGSHTVTGSIGLLDGLDSRGVGSYHLRAVNSHLVLSSSAGSIVAFSSSGDFTNADKAYHIRSVNSNLILSSSAGSVVAVSASVDLVNTDKNYHINAVNSRLILSSSAGSIVTVSGSLLALSGAGLLIRGTTANDIKLRVISNAILDVVTATDTVATVNASAYRDNGSSFTLSNDKLELRRIGKVSFDKNNSGTGGGGDEFQLVNATGFLPAGTSTSGTLGLSSSLANTVVNGMTVASLRGHLILSSSEGSVIGHSGSADFTETNKNYHIRATNDHLVLSSSTSVIRISGALAALDTTTAALPAAAIVLSGSIVWDSTRKALKVYGPEGWTVLATGTVG